jgi:hypothetical protein
MPTFAAPVDLLGSELRNFVVQTLPIDPTSYATPGRLYYNSATQMLRFRNDTDFVDLASADSLGALAALDEITGLQIQDGSITSNDISGVAGIQYSQLEEIPGHTLIGNQYPSTFPAMPLTGSDVMALLSGTATTPFSFNGRAVGGVADPSVATDVANKAYVDASRGGFSLKDPVDVATTGDIVLSGPQTIDGFAVSDGTRVLVKDQSLPEQNGIWTASSGVWTRAVDADEDSEVSNGMALWVSYGDANTGMRYVLTTPDPITVGTTPLVFTLDSAPGGSGSMTGTADHITVTGNQIDIATTYVGQASIDTVGTIRFGAWQGTAVAVANGGTGANDAMTARTNLAAAGSFLQMIEGDGTATSFVVTHGSNNPYVSVQVIDRSSSQVVYLDATMGPGGQDVTISGFSTPPPIGKQYFVHIVG